MLPLNSQHGSAQLLGPLTLEQTLTLGTLAPLQVKDNSEHLKTGFPLDVIDKWGLV